MYEQQILDSLERNFFLSQKERSLFMSLLEHRQLQKRDYLLRIGEICRYDHFVLKGCMKVCYNDEKGVEKIIKFAPENWWVVDIDSFLHAKPSFYYIQALEDCELFQLSRTNYHRLHEEIPAFQKFSHQRWQNGFIALQQRILQSQSMTAEERFEHFLQKYPGLDQRIPQKLIAAYLGITPEFLSMLRKKWASRFS